MYLLITQVRIQSYSHSVKILWCCVPKFTETKWDSWSQGICRIQEPTYKIFPVFTEQKNVQHWLYFTCKTFKVLGENVRCIKYVITLEWTTIYTKYVFYTYFVFCIKTTIFCILKSTGYKARLNEISPI